MKWYQLEQSKCPAVNAIEIRTQHITSLQKEAILNLPIQFTSLISDTKERINANLKKQLEYGIKTNPGKLEIIKKFQHLRHRKNSDRFWECHDSIYISLNTILN